jgi:carbon storage regulator
MLVLTRKQNEEIVIGENIRIAIVGVRGKRVRLGIAAPAEISVSRTEADPDAATHPDIEMPGPIRTAQGCISSEAFANC